MSQSSGGNNQNQQHEALVRLAREKVLSAYGRTSSPAFVEQKPAPAPKLTQSQAAQKSQAIQRFNAQQQRRNMPAVSQQTQNDTATLQQYHAAWANYYQKYYHEYYNKAATNFARTEKEKTAKDKEETEKLKEHLEHEHSKVHKPLTKAQQMREDIRERATGSAEKVRKSRHFIPLLVGLSIILIVLFLQYNRNLIAPVMAYISPGNIKPAEISEIDPTVTSNVGPAPLLLIPKLSVRVPVAFSIPNDQASINAAMHYGVAHFSIPGANALPGEIGNLVISGHSASDIYTQSDFKFIFSGLERLEEKDLIYVNYEGKRYTYAVTRKQVVAPTDVQALIYDTEVPVLTLITCVPIGTARSRLLVTAEQVSPDPRGATTPMPGPGDEPPVTQVDLPSNPPTFFESIWNWLTGQG